MDDIDATAAEFAREYFRGHWSTRFRTPEELAAVLAQFGRAVVEARSRVAFDHMRANYTSRMQLVTMKETPSKEE